MPQKYGYMVDARRILLYGWFHKNMVVWLMPQDYSQCRNDMVDAVPKSKKGWLQRLINIFSWIILWGGNVIFICIVDCVEGCCRPPLRFNRLHTPPQTTGINRCTISWRRIYNMFIKKWMINRYRIWNGQQDQQMYNIIKTDL